MKGCMRPPYTSFFGGNLSISIPNKRFKGYKYMIKNKFSERKVKVKSLSHV